jgi:Sulfotransferase family
VCPPCAERVASEPARWRRTQVQGATLCQHRAVKRVGDAAASGLPAPFIVGVGRSGTTLLRMMLDAHPDLAIPPETYFVPRLAHAAEGSRLSPELFADTAVDDHRHRWKEFGVSREDYLNRLRAMPRLNPGDAARAFFQLYAENAGKPRWGDKTPGYIARMRRISRMLPESRFIHVIRDGRDVALSWRRRLAHRGLDWLMPIEHLAERWRSQILQAREDSGALPYYMEVRYEQLVLDTESTLRRVTEFVELPWAPVMLDYHAGAAERHKELTTGVEGDARQRGQEQTRAHALTTKPPQRQRVGAWKKEMSPADRAVFEREAGDLLSELGYAPAEARLKQGATWQGRPA